MPGLSAAVGEAAGDTSDAGEAGPSGAPPAAMCATRADAALRSIVACGGTAVAAASGKASDRRFAALRSNALRGDSLAAAFSGEGCLFAVRPAMDRRSAARGDSCGGLVGSSSGKWTFCAALRVRRSAVRGDSAGGVGEAGQSSGKWTFCGPRAATVSKDPPWETVRGRRPVSADAARRSRFARGDGGGAAAVAAAAGVDDADVVDVVDVADGVDGESAGRLFARGRAGCSVGRLFARGRMSRRSVRGLGLTFDMLRKRPPAPACCSTAAMSFADFPTSLVMAGSAPAARRSSTARSFL
mmetsp:Transcript_21396/g.72466  ORF Transcript_21396/g.72466 Transcript_21396/m.72466 type:complete len:299 (+) Transcript_21396:90-986(+)